MTRTVKVDPENPEESAIAEAAEILRRGGLVAFPTETVYGLGALALDEVCVRRIFEAKGRPAINPIIVHVSDRESAKRLTTDWTSGAERLANTFWPGPLTLVLRRHASVPDIVAAGGPTVGVRCPANRIALALLNATGQPLAAPSANPSNYLSPTTAAHVLKGLDGKVDLILDGGPTRAGIESTVFDLTVTPPTVLRTGPIAFTQIEKELDVRCADQTRGSRVNSVMRSPGQLTRHYSPKTPLLLAANRDELQRMIAERTTENARIAVLSFPPALKASATIRPITMPSHPQEFAASIYSELHAVDELGVHCILVEAPPDTVEWQAVLDRLRRAASRPS